MDMSLTQAPTQAPTHYGAVAPGTPLPQHVKRLQLILVKPSKYDDDGYVMRYVRGVLPSNTMAALAGLTQEVIDRGTLGHIKVDVLMLDEIVNRIDARKLARKYLKPGVQPLVALCGVQTNQFPRAADMALEFKAAGMPVMIGGFHVSGAIALSQSGMPPECQAMIDAGITLVKGEVEDVWDQLLIDAVHGRLRSFYDIIERPDISHAHIPVVNPRLLKKFAYPYMGTIDTGRGCPFNCSFCTIINVQGKQMRCRSAEMIKDRIKRNAALKIDYYFFTDDNFSRNPNWEEILDALIELRRDDGIALQFMMQIDTKAYRIKNFMAKAAQAGCSQVFIGMETLNGDNIKAIGKMQNTVDDYRHMVEAWHANGIACHVGYIIGFPYDTVATVTGEVLRLRDEIGVDQASFFMLTPLPGSMDHVHLQESGEWMDPDYNRFDSFHTATHHPRMSDEEWFGVYKQAWRDFYTVDGMKGILSRANGHTYWGLFKNFLWYKYSAVIEETHPMVCGFLRLKDRLQRRPGHAVEGRLRHLRRRVADYAVWARRLLGFYFEMQEVWLATRGRSQFNQNIDTHPIRTRWAARMHKINPLAIHTPTRMHLNSYWRQTWGELRRGRVFAINPFRLAGNFLRDVKLCTLFSLSVFVGYGR